MTPPRGGSTLWVMHFRTLVKSLVLVASVALPGTLKNAAGQVPDGFQIETWPGDWRELVGIVPVGDGRFVAWERGGLAWMVGPDGLASVEPLVDLTQEVNPYRDHGMLGLALDPAFLENGFVYLLYAVDRHHLDFFGTPDYDAETDDHVSATIGRITRYTATASSDRSVTDPSSRMVLLGNSIPDGLPLINTSHGVGSLVFGEDGTLLCSMGDTGGYTADFGGPVPGGWVEQGLADGIISSDENVGSYRAQMIDSLAGKILRLDPATGEGVASNPWYDAESPRRARSRVWTLGLRNAYRMTLTPGTGSPDPADANPGEIVYGDVGGGFREEVSVVDRGGMNLGWPLFEGYSGGGGFWGSDTLHPTITNPLAGPDCPEALRFRDLIVEEGELRCNPCDPAWVEADAWEGATPRTNSSGWTGQGHVDFGGSAGDWIEYVITVPDRGKRTYAVRYANGGTIDRPIEVLLNGKAIAELPLSPTRGWDTWNRASFSASLPAGDHVIRLVALGSSNVFVDRIDTRDLPFSTLDESISFVHDRPMIDWRHNTAEARVPATTTGGAASVAVLGDPDCPVLGDSFAGNCATAGARITDPRWPAEWRGIFFADFIFGWMRVMRFDADGEALAVDNFYNAAGQITSLTHDPYSGALLAIRWSNSPIRIVPPAPPDPADLSGDGEVDGADLGLLLAAWNTSGPGDLDGDGVVNGADLGLMLASFTVPPTPCPPDLDRNRTVDSSDLGLLLALWGEQGDADLDGSGVVDAADIGLVLAAWGPCE